MEMKIYAEWMCEGELHEGEFDNWRDFTAATFNMDVQLLYFYTISPPKAC